jgi:hypothetical protein
MQPLQTEVLCYQALTVMKASLTQKPKIHAHKLLGFLEYRTVYL